MHLDLLAIAAHPDDVELTCGGTLLKMAQRGYKTGILDLTAGEMGTRGTPETRAKEAAKAAKLLSVKWRGTLGVPVDVCCPRLFERLQRVRWRSFGGAAEFGTTATRFRGERYRSEIGFVA